VLSSELADSVWSVLVISYAIISYELHCAYLFGRLLIVLAKMTF